MEILAKEQVEQAEWSEERKARIENKLQLIVVKQANELEVLGITHQKIRAGIVKAMNAELEQYGCKGYCL